jgi:hypothetical protein
VWMVWARTVWSEQATMHRRILLRVEVFMRNDVHWWPEEVISQHESSVYC